ncbi:MAG: hypothetical protein VKN33_05270 [Candidatus Sericytochromatia bacterium]|nr:hypothetical protein [Candidatus Sericytochromatia bacterium]
MKISPREPHGDRTQKTPSNAQSASGKSPRPLNTRAPGTHSAHEQDSFKRHPRDSAENNPYWLIAMSADRATGRRYLDSQAVVEAQGLEALWINEWAQRLPEVLDVPDSMDSLGQRQIQWQRCVESLCALSGFTLDSPAIVWQPAMRVHRGQYLFQSEGSLLQLRPDAAGTPSDWLATVAHETFHHAQHQLILCLYRGTASLPFPFGALAAYYRDARNIYRVPGPECPPEKHRQQWLEIGAWRFGQAVVTRCGGPQ